MQATKLLLAYPTIIERTPMSFNGFLTIDDTDFIIFFVQTEDKRIIVNYPKSPKLLPYREKIDSFTNNKPFDFLRNLEQFLKIQSELVKKNVTIYTNYRAVLNDYVEFCQFYFNIAGSFITPDLSQIKLSYTDERKRQFSVDISICYSKSYFTYKISNASIPSFNLEGCSSLVTIYNYFGNLIESARMQSYFDFLDEIDANCWILDPEKPSYKINYRRIVLETNTSALLHIYENNAKGLPEIKIFGTQQRIEYFTDKIAANFDNWEQENDLLEELLKLFDIAEFPRKSSQNCDQDCLLNDGECCICFALRFEDCLPDVVCSNSSCNQIFHQKCLFQWLSVINAGFSVYEIYGPCPNCEKSIHCPIIN